MVGLGEFIMVLDVECSCEIGVSRSDALGVMPLPNHSHDRSFKVTYTLVLLTECISFVKPEVDRVRCTVECCLPACAIIRCLPG